MSQRRKVCIASGISFFAAAFFMAGVTFALQEPPVCPYMWMSTLRIGSSGESVLKLQEFLNSDPATVIATSGAGSPGSETETYGSRTAKAVSKFQEEYAADILTPNGLSSGTGVVGPATRARLNSLCGNSTRQGPPLSMQEATGSLDVLTVSDPSQSPSAIVPAGSGAQFLAIQLQAGDRDVIVNSLTVKRAGAGADGAFSSLALFGPNGLQIGNIQSLNSLHEVAFPGPILIPAGTSQTLQVWGNMAADFTDFDGQTPSLELENVNASSPVSGTLPLAGPAETLNNSLVVGGASAEVSSFDPRAATIHYINDKKVIFSGIRITADSVEDLSLSNIIWQQDGTAGPNDIANVSIVVNGVSVSTSTSADVLGREYIGFFNPAIVIPKGQSIEVYVRGDLTTTGANRTVEFDINDNTDDIALTGNTYNFAVGIAPDTDTAETGNSVFITSDGMPEGTAGTPFYAGSIVTISPGALETIHG